MLPTSARHIGGVRRDAGRLICRTQLSSFFVATLCQGNDYFGWDCEFSAKLQEMKTRTLDRGDRGWLTEYSGLRSACYWSPCLQTIARLFEIKTSHLLDGCCSCGNRRACLTQGEGPRKRKAILSTGFIPRARTLVARGRVIIIISP